MNRHFACLFVVALGLAAITRVSADEAKPAAAAAPAVHTAEGETAAETPAKTTLKIAANETVIQVDNMHCAGCAKKIAGRLYLLKGVVKVRMDVKAHLAVITPQTKKDVDVKAAWDAVQKAGFQPTKLTSPQGTFVSHEKTKKPERVADAATTKHG